MSSGIKLVAVVVFVVLAWGLSAPWQGVSEPIFFGFLPAPVFYLVVVHLLFVVFIGLLAFKTRFHGKVEDEKSFLAEIRSSGVPK